MKLKLTTTWNRRDKGLVVGKQEQKREETPKVFQVDTALGAGVDDSEVKTNDPKSARRARCTVQTFSPF